MALIGWSMAWPAPGPAWPPQPLINWLMPSIIRLMLSINRPINATSSPICWPASRPASQPGTSQPASQQPPSQQPASSQPANQSLHFSAICSLSISFQFRACTNEMACRTWYKDCNTGWSKATTSFARSVKTRSAICSGGKPQCCKPRHHRMICTMSRSKTQTPKLWILKNEEVVICVEVGMGCMGRPKCNKCWPS